MGSALERRTRRAAIKTSAGQAPGEAPGEDPGPVVSGDVVRSYLNRVDAQYDALQRSVARTMGETANPTQAQWDFVSDWGRLLANWKTFYAESIDDWIAWGSTYSETRTYHQSVIARAELFAQVFKTDPPPILPIPKPNETPSVLDKVSSVAKWAVVGVIVYAIGKAASK